MRKEARFSRRLQLEGGDDISLYSWRRRGSTSHERYFRQRLPQLPHLPVLLDHVHHVSPQSVTYYPQSSM